MGDLVAQLRATATGAEQGDSTASSRQPVKQRVAGKQRACLSIINVFPFAGCNASAASCKPRK